MALTPLNWGPLSHVSYALWTVQGSNLRPPVCKTGALPIELTAQVWGAGVEPASGHLADAPPVKLQPVLAPHATRA